MVRVPRRNRVTRSLAGTLRGFMAADADTRRQGERLEEGLSPRTPLPISGDTDVSGDEEPNAQHIPDPQVPEGMTRLHEHSPVTTQVTNNLVETRLTRLEEMIAMLLDQRTSKLSPQSYHDDINGGPGQVG